MTRRPYHRPAGGRDRDRTDRRAVVDVLLARAQRGALSPAEGALLTEHVREEMRLADENRLAMASTTRALAKHREAADAAIREAEQRAAEVERARDQAEQRTQEVRRVAAEQHAAVTRVIALVGRHGAVPAEAVWAAVDADPAEHRTADDRARRWKDETQDSAAALDRKLGEIEQQLAAVEAERDRLANDVEAMHDGINQAAREAFAERKRHRAAEQATRDQYEQQLADNRAAVARVRILAQRMRAGSPQGAAAIYADRIEQALDNDTRALDADTEVRARILDRADSAEARLAEQQRKHDVALATERQHLADVSREAREQKQRADRAEAERDQAREQRNEWARQADAEILAHRQRADRNHAAWRSARRRALAAEQALATELPAVEAEQRARALAEEWTTTGRTPAERDAGRRLLATLGPHDDQLDPDAPIPYQLAEQSEPTPAECRHPYHLHQATRPGPECQ